MAHATLSTSLDDTIAERLKGLARREDRSTSSLIANAVALYTAMPKELRETLRLFASEDQDFLRAVLLEMTALAAERKFDLARRELVKTTSVVPELAEASDADLAELALKITSQR